MSATFDLGAMLVRLAQQCRDIAILFLDPEGRIRYASPGAEEIFGHRAEDLVGLPASRLFTREDVDLGAPEQEIAMAAANHVAEDDRWQLRRDGSRFFANGLLVPLRDEAGRLAGYAKVLRNRTDVKEQLETLRNAAGQLERAARARDIFLATVSHELRNPLAPLANAVHILQVAAEGSPERAQGLKVIERQVALLGRLVDDLMDLSRLSVGKVEMQLRHLVLQAVLAGAVEAARPLLAEREQHVELVLAAGDIDIEGDPDRLHQVFTNLVTNASKYTPARGRIWVSATIEGREAVARVIDTGVGIASDMLPRIFDLFTQVETTRGESRGGLGIGLAVVKDLVALHGGTVQARSDGPGKGSEFVVRLPVSGSRPDSPQAGKPPQASA